MYEWLLITAILVAVFATGLLLYERNRNKKMLDSLENMYFIGIRSIEPDEFELHKNNNIQVGGACDIQSVEFDPSLAPFVALYGGATWRIELDDQWGKLLGYPSWGYA